MTPSTVPSSMPNTPPAAVLPGVSPEVLELAVKEATTPLEWSELVVGKQYPAIVGKPGAKNTMLKLPQMTMFTYLGAKIQYKSDGEHVRVIITDKLSAMAVARTASGIPCYLPGVWSYWPETWGFDNDEGDLVYLLPADYQGGTIKF